MTYQNGTPKCRLQRRLGSCRDDKSHGANVIAYWIVQSVNGCDAYDGRILELAGRRAGAKSYYSVTSNPAEGRRLSSNGEGGRQVVLTPDIVVLSTGRCCKSLLLLLLLLASQAVTYRSAPAERCADRPVNPILRQPRFQLTNPTPALFLFSCVQVYFKIWQHKCRADAIVTIVRQTGNLANVNHTASKNTTEIKTKIRITILSR